MEVCLLSNRVEAFARFNATSGNDRPTRLYPPGAIQGRICVRSRRMATRLTHSLCIQSARDDADELIFIARPDGATAVLDFLLPWARICLAEVRRHFQVRGDMNLAQTIGGGWASVKNVKESLRWALILRHLGRQLGDLNCERKCEVFIGWAHLWNGNKGRSLEIFTHKLEEALAVNDDINWNRCTAALSHARFNPEFSWDAGRVDLPVEVTSQRPEELIDQSIKRRNISKDCIRYADPNADTHNRGDVEDAGDDYDVEREWNVLIS